MNHQNIKPTGIQVLFNNQPTAGSNIIIPDGAIADMDSVILAVGPEVKGFKVGDHMLTSEKDVLRVPRTGEALYICPETSIVARIEGGEA